MKVPGRNRLLLTIITVTALLAALVASPAFGAGGDDRVPDRYIVTFTDDVANPATVAKELAQTHGLGLRHTYTAALKGFAALIPDARLDKIQNDARVRYIIPDQVDVLHPQGTPTGVNRIEVDLNPAPTAADPVDLDIAVIDTGIDLDHPDLNVVSYISFTGIGGGGDEDNSSPAGGDNNGHGTHVAGTLAARDNGIDVVGVAPRARLHAIQVCNSGGLCARSDIIAGIDYLTANAGVIEVANMSLGGSGSDDGNCGLSNNDPEHEAICNAVAAGVVFVVSAGNSSANAANFIPAAYDEVITVSALADFNGKAGGGGDPTCRTDEDDSFANFSNFGADVDLMAPGVCILSTWKNGGTNTISGTSMASPHVAGTVGLYIAKNGRATNSNEVYAIRDALVAAGIQQTDACGLSTFDDPDGIAEPIVFANAMNVGGDGTCYVAGGPPAPVTDIAITAVSAPTSVVKGDVVNVGVTVENVGNQDLSTDITVTLSDDTDAVTIGPQTIGGLVAGASTTLTYSWNTSGASTGDHTLTASHDLSDDNAANNSLSTIVTVEAAVTDVAVTDVAVTTVSAPASAVQGDVVSVDVTVANVGNQDVTADIAVSLSDMPPAGGISGTVSVPQTIAGGLVAGAFTTLTFSWDTTDASAGAHTLTGGHDFAEDATNNSMSAGVTVNEPGLGTAPVVDACAPNIANPGEQPTVTVTGSNFQDGATVDFG